MRKWLLRLFMCALCLSALLSTIYVFTNLTLGHF
ncbi:hypothetical protein SAMN05421737_102271 [Shouchella lonarensis]|uniref:Uncharacterized protein n=1 Tax=Shouchella lonarensis TaxID=1464122 RepID=A0A1G6H2N3_9BACI|nr:hypothetical protein SAMN05421737_102271 [Shouchella lonarensis]